MRESTSVCKRRYNTCTVRAGKPQPAACVLLLHNLGLRFVLLLLVDTPD